MQDNLKVSKLHCVSNPLPWKPTYSQVPRLGCRHLWGDHSFASHTSSSLPGSSFEFLCPPTLLSLNCAGLLDSSLLWCRSASLPGRRILSELEQEWLKPGEAGWTWTGPWDWRGGSSGPSTGEGGRWPEAVVEGVRVWGTDLGPCKAPGESAVPRAYCWITMLSLQCQPTHLFPQTHGEVSANCWKGTANVQVMKYSLTAV